MESEDALELLCLQENMERAAAGKPEDVSSTGVVGNKADARESMETKKQILH